MDLPQIESEILSLVRYPLSLSWPNPKIKDNNNLVHKSTFRLSDKNPFFLSYVASTSAYSSKASVVV